MKKLIQGKESGMQRAFFINRCDATEYANFQYVKAQPSNSNVSNRIALLTTEDGRFKTLVATLESDQQIKHIFHTPELACLIGKYSRYGNSLEDPTTYFGDPDGTLRRRFKGLISNHSLITALEDERKIIYTNYSSYFRNNDILNYLKNSWLQKTEEHLQNWLHHHRICLAAKTSHLASAQTIQCMLGYKGDVEKISAFFQYILAESNQDNMFYKLWTYACGLVRLNNTAKTIFNEQSTQNHPNKNTSTLTYFLINNGLSKIQIIDNLITTFVAGQETYGNLLGFLLYELSKSPELQRIIREEILELDRMFNLEDAPRLYSLVLEGLRMYPTGGFTRCAKEDIVIGQATDLEQPTEQDCYLIKKGESLIYFPYANGQNPEVWSNPTLFDPERHLNNLKLKGLPFGAGLDACPARKTSIVQLAYTLSILLKSAEFYPIEHQDPGELIMATTLKFSNSLFEIGIRKI